jgi:hypothetical protein
VAGAVGQVSDPVRDPGLVERGQLRMAGRDQHHGRGPQGLPGRPVQQPGRYPRAGREDDQQAGVSPDGSAVGVGPAVRATVGTVATTAYWL